MGPAHESGSLAPGKWADVVLLNADPLADLRALVAPCARHSGGLDRVQRAAPQDTLERD